MIPWHRLFGITLTDFFTDTAFRVELEKDLSLKQQLLDVVIIEKGEGSPPAELPDGLEDIGPHNLMTYKSHQQSLDAWTLDELTGHYVNYRKSITPKPGNLPSCTEFRLYAVTARYPAKLGDEVELEELKEGVYDVKWGIRKIRIIVLSRISRSRKNAVWHLFSAIPEKVVMGVSQYQWRSSPSLAINELFKAYQLEGIIAMPYTLEDFQKDCVREHIHRFSPKEILENYPLEELLKAIPAEELLKGIPNEELFELLKKRFSESDRTKIHNLLEGQSPEG